MTDENGATATATFTITVNGADNEVVAVTDTGAVDAGSTLSVSVEGRRLTYLMILIMVKPMPFSVGEASVTEIRTGRENRTGKDGTVGSELGWNIWYPYAKFRWHLYLYC